MSAADPATIPPPTAAPTAASPEVIPLRSGLQCLTRLRPPIPARDPSTAPATAEFARWTWPRVWPPGGCRPQPGQSACLQRWRNLTRAAAQARSVLLRTPECTVRPVAPRLARDSVVGTSAETAYDRGQRGARRTSLRTIGGTRVRNIQILAKSVLWTGLWILPCPRPSRAAIEPRGKVRSPPTRAGADRPPPSSPWTRSRWKEWSCRPTSLTSKSLLSLCRISRRPADFGPAPGGPGE
jgi:hypothetical protein